MRSKDFYIEEISHMLSKADSETVEAVFRVLAKLSKGGSSHGFKKYDHRDD